MVHPFETRGGTNVDCDPQLDERIDGGVVVLERDVQRGPPLGVEPVRIGSELDESLFDGAVA